MNHTQLEQQLQTLNDREQIYKKQPHLSDRYNSFDKIIHNDSEVYVFTSQIPINSNIYISQHNRFVEVPMHLHTFIELTYVYSGECTQIINGKKIILKKNQICIVDTGVPHSILPANEEDIIINILIRRDYFTSSFLSRLSKKGIISDFLINAISDTKNHNQYIIFHSENNDNITLLFKQLICEHFDKSICSEEMIDCYMILIFSELIRVFQYDTNYAKDDSRNQTRIIDLLQYIEKNYQNCTLVSLAKEFNYNPNYLSTILKRKTGKTFKELVQIQKLTHSSLLLTNTDKPIYEIAEETGHTNLSYFYKKFREYFGITPQEYREGQSRNG